MLYPLILIWRYSSRPARLRGHSPTELRSDLTAQVQCLEYNRLVWIAKFEILQHDHSEKSRQNDALDDLLFPSRTKQMLWQKDQINRQRRISKKEVPWSIHFELEECDFKIREDERTAKLNAQIAADKSSESAYKTKYGRRIFAAERLRNYKVPSAEEVVDESFTTTAEETATAQRSSSAEASAVRESSVEASSSDQWMEAQQKRKAAEAPQHAEEEVEFVRAQKRVRRQTSKAREMAHRHKR
ncbi:hypothetical protein MMC13_006817 [Lambiella insularis]|nr:hypothetical protein [Lambiella insularis]